VAYGKVTYS